MKPVRPKKALRVLTGLSLVGMTASFFLWAGHCWAPQRSAGILARVVGYEPTYVAVRAGRPMALGLSSYADPQLVRSILERRKLAWSEEELGAREGEHKFPLRRLPPYRHLVFHIDSLTFEGQLTRVELRFLNDRLFEIQFRPANPAAFRATAVNGKLRKVAGWHIRLEAGPDETGSPCVRLFDLRLTQESLRWLAEYA